MSDTATVSYPRQVQGTPCTIDLRDGQFVCLIPMPEASTARCKVWEKHCLTYAQHWLRNEPEEITQVCFVLSPEAAARIAAAQARRTKRAQRAGVERL